MIAVPATQVLDAVKDAARLESPRRVISSGLGELGPEGAATQHEILRTGPRAQHPALGPNRLGVMINDPGSG